MGARRLIKYGMIADAGLLDMLKMPPAAAGRVIARCVSIKRDIVCGTSGFGARRLLNFGHTIRHALKPSAAIRFPRQRGLRRDGYLAQAPLRQKRPVR